MSVKKDVDAMDQKYVGHVFRGCTVQKFLYRMDFPCGTTDWRVLAQCVCGRLFECRFTTLRYYENPSCGCRRRGVSQKSKDSWNRSISPKEKAKDEAVEASPRKPRTDSFVIASIGLSEARIAKVWEQLDHDACCPAWKHGPDKFVAWALHNGWARGKELVRIDVNKPWHPSNVRWQEI